MKRIVLLILVLAAVVTALVLFQSRIDKSTTVADKHQPENGHNTVNESSKLIQNEPNNVNQNIGHCYTDYIVDDFSGDMTGTLMVRFEKQANGIYEAFIEQRYGTEGGTHPEQKAENLIINDNGFISFEVLWFEYDWRKDEVVSQKTKFEGAISVSQLIIISDLPDAEETTLRVL